MLSLWVMYPKQKAKQHFNVLLFPDIISFVPSDVKPLSEFSSITPVQFYAILIWFLDISVTSLIGLVLSLFFRYMYFFTMNMQIFPKILYMNCWNSKATGGAVDQNTGFSLSWDFQWISCVKVTAKSFKLILNWKPEDELSVVLTCLGEARILNEPSKYQFPTGCNQNPCLGPQG